MRTRPRAPYVLLFCSLALAGPTRAATFNVNSTTDAVDAHPGDGACATAAPTPVCTLRAAIQEANALRGADVINLQAQTYRSEEHTSELQSHSDLVCRLLLEKKKLSNRKLANRPLNIRVH